MQPVLEREHVRREGHAAIRWLEQRAWALSDTARNIVLIADELLLPTLAVRRLRHTAISLASTGATDISRGHLLLLIDGELTISTLTHSGVVLTPGATVSWHFPATLTITASEPVTWMQIDSAALPTPKGGPRWDLPRVNATVEPTAALVAHTVGAVLDHGAGFSPDVTTLVELSIESAALAHAMATMVDPDPAQSLYHRARVEITRHGHQSTFTVDELAKRLHVSRGHLARVFRSRGATVQQALIAHRLATAERLRAAEPWSEEAALAATCGFSSARAMREARQRFAK